MQKWFCLLWVTMLLSCTAHGPEAVGPATAQGSHREDLIEAYRREGKMLFVYGTGDSAAANQYRILLGQMSGQKSRMTMVIRSDREVTDAELHTHALYLIGTPANNAVLKRLLPQLPFQITPQTLDFNQQQYGDHPTLSLGFYPNPMAPELPLSLTTGLSDADVYQQLQKSFGQQYFWFAISGWGYQLYDGGRRKVMGFFDESDPKQWKIGRKTHWDFADDGSIAEENAHIIYYNHQSAYGSEIALKMTNDLQQSWNKLLTGLQMQMPSKKAAIHLYPSAELKGLATGNTKPAHLDEVDGSLHVSIHAENAGREDYVGNIWLVRSLLGAAKMPQLELGLSVMATDHWQKYGWKHWAKKFEIGGSSLRIDELLDPQIWEHESPYLKECMSAALVDFLIAKWGAAAFVQFYNSPNPQRLLDLQSEFEASLRVLPETATTPQFNPMPPFQKAFNFAHEGYQIFNGYLSTEASNSIDYTAKKLHCNALAVIPYAGMADVHAPAWLDFSEGAGAENDESIVHCIWSARQSGETVMIKPQVWPWKDWTGEVSMQNDADWKIFFDRYYRWIRHYAIMAELYEAEILCVGVEFSKATLQRPDDWRNMVNRLRGVYHGKITYAANWGEEFEKCQFWDALDYVGINCYYPISKKEKPSQKELNAGFADVIQKVEKVALTAKKPVLFTEIGFRSCASPWANPHAEADDRPADDEAQAACYRAMIAGLQNKPWCKGVYLWKWPAYMDDAQYDRRGFTPLGHPAEQLVEEWFGKN